MTFFAVAGRSGFAAAAATTREEKISGSSPTPRRLLAAWAMKRRRESSSARRRGSVMEGRGLLNEQKLLRVDERGHDVLGGIEPLRGNLGPACALALRRLAGQQREVGRVDPF